MDLNTPARRRVIIQALRDEGDWTRKVQGYQLTFVRELGKVGWIVDLPKTRKFSGWSAAGISGTVFDALADVEIVIEKRLMRTE